MGLALTFETIGSLSAATSLYQEARTATRSRDPFVLAYLGDVLAVNTSYTPHALSPATTATAAATKSSSTHRFMNPPPNPSTPPNPATAGPRVRG